MGFLLPKAPAPQAPPNPSILASGTSSGGFGNRPSDGSFLSATSPTLKRKSETIKTSLIGGG